MKSTDAPIRRQAFLAGLASSAALAACGGGGASGGGMPVAGPTPMRTPNGPVTSSPSPTPASSPTSTPVSAKVPLTIDATQTDLPPGTLVYAYIIGGVRSGGIETFYRLDASGMPIPIGTRDNTQAAGTFPGANALASGDAATLAANYPLAWADYSIPISPTSKTILDLARVNSANIPALGTGTAAFSGRIYLSVGVPKLPFTAIGPTRYVAPVVQAPPGNLTLFDWIEFSYDSEGNFNGNTTQVDQFGMPLQLSGTPGGVLQGRFNRSRQAIITDIAGMGAAYSGLQVPVTAPSAYPAGTNSLRVVSPAQRVSGSGYSGALQTYYDAAIAQCYDTWRTAPLVVRISQSAVYTGIVLQSGDLTFYSGALPSLTSAQASAMTPAFTVAPSNRISSTDIWQCAGSLVAGGSDQKDVEKAIAAAFNRGVIEPTLDLTTCRAGAAAFYPSGVASNTWAQKFHQYSANGLAYGFPYDDVCEQNPSIGLSGTASVTIVLGKLLS